MQRWIAAILAVFNILNGLVMLFAGSILVGERSRRARDRPLQPAFRPGRRRGVPGGRARAGRAGLAAGVLAGGAWPAPAFWRPTP